MQVGSGRIEDLKVFQEEFSEQELDKMIESGEIIPADLNKLPKELEEKLNKRAKDAVERSIKHYDLVEVPSDPHKRFVMSNWGLKKRERYRDLLKLNHSKNDAYQAVEFNKGEINETQTEGNE